MAFVRREQIYFVEILNGKYAGHHPVRPVNTGITPIIPHQEESANPAPIINNPTSIRTILSVSPTLHAIILPFSNNEFCWNFSLFGLVHLSKFLVEALKIA